MRSRRERPPNTDETRSGAVIISVMVAGGGPDHRHDKGNAMLIDEPALGRLVRRMQARLDRPVLCAYGTAGEMSEPRCEALITRRSSRAAGHPGYCSHAHAALAQDDQIL